MDLVIILLFVVIIVSMTALLADVKSSHSIRQNGKKLTIWYPLKKEKINLDSDLKGWSVQQTQRLGTGNLYLLKLQLKSGTWRKVYSKSRDGRIGQLIQYLEKSSGERQLKV